MRKCIIFLLSILIAFSLVGCTKENNSPNTFVDIYKNKATEYIENGDLESAITVLEEGVSKTNDEELKKMLGELQNDNSQKNSSETSADNNSSQISSSKSKVDKEATKENSLGNSVSEMDDNTIRAILNGQKSFIDFDSKLEATIRSLPQVNSQYTEKPGMYAVVDLDNNGTKELLIEYVFNGDTAIINIQNGKYIAYYIPYRSRSRLKTDGTMSWSNGASESGVKRVSFGNEGIISTDIIVYSEDLFTVNGNTVTKEEYEKALSEQDRKKDAEWISLPSEPFDLTDYVDWWAENDDVYTQGGMELLIHDPGGEDYEFMVSLTKKNGIKVAHSDYFAVAKNNIWTNQVFSSFTDSFGNTGKISIQFLDGKVICNVYNFESPKGGSDWGIYDGEYVLTYYDTQH